MQFFTFRTRRMKHLADRELGFEGVVAAHHFETALSNDGSAWSMPSAPGVFTFAECGNREEAESMAASIIARSPDLFATVDEAEDACRRECCARTSEAVSRKTKPVTALAPKVALR